MATKSSSYFSQFFTLLMIALFTFGCNQPPKPATATALPPTQIVATANPTEPPVKYDFKVQEAGAYAMNGGNSFHFKLAVEESLTGRYTSKIAANKAMFAATSDFSDNHCFDDWSSGDYQIIANGTNVSRDCQNLVETIIGSSFQTTMSDELVQSLVEADAKLVNADNRDFMYISEGRILGTSDTLFSISRGCEIKSLEYAGYRVGKQLTVIHWFPMDVFKILYRNGLFDRSVWGEELPDFCGSDLLTKTTKPNWLSETHRNDMYQYGVGGFSVQIHTDTTKCDQQNWTYSGKDNFVIISGPANKPIRVMINDGDLIELEVYTNNQHRQLYITIINDQPVFYTQPFEYFKVFAVVKVTNACDGFGNDCSGFATDRYPLNPYMTEDGVVIKQTLPLEDAKNK